MDSEESLSEIHLLVVPNREERKGEFQLVFTQSTMLIRTRERPQVERVELLEAAKRQDDESELVLAAADVGPVTRADQLPQTLVLRSPVPDLAHARRRC